MEKIGGERPFRKDFFNIICDIECSKNPFESAMALSRSVLLSLSFCQLHYLSRFAITEEQKSTMFNRMRKVWLKQHGKLSILPQAPPETAAPINLDDENHSDRIHTLFSVFAHYCACPLDAEGHISFASDFTREAFIYIHEEPTSFSHFVDPAQRYRLAISDPISWTMFQLKARIVNRDISFPPMISQVFRGTSNGTSQFNNLKPARRRMLTTYAGYCDTFSISTDPSSLAEAELRRIGNREVHPEFAIPSLSDLAITLKVKGKSSLFAFACPAKKVLLNPPKNTKTKKTGDSILFSSQNSHAFHNQDEKSFLDQLQYYHILETMRYYAQSRFAPWADEDTKPQLAALISRSHYFRSKLIARGLLPEDAPWVFPPSIGAVKSGDLMSFTVDHLRTPRRDAQLSFALNPRYNCATRIEMRILSDNSTNPIYPLARHYINKEQQAPEIFMHMLFPHHYFRSTQTDDTLDIISSDPPRETLLPGDAEKKGFLPPLYSLPLEKIDTDKLLKRRSVGQSCRLVNDVETPESTTVHKRMFSINTSRQTKSLSEIASIAQSTLLRKFVVTLGIAPNYFRVKALNDKLQIECDDPAFIHYASLLSFVDDLLESARTKPFPLHPLLLRLFAVRPRHHNFEHYGWEGPANGFFDLVHIYCFARVLAHWCNHTDSYLPKGVSPDKYLCTPADSSEHFNHYLTVHKYIALFAAGDGSPILDSIRERGLIANIGRFLTFRSAVYLHRDVYMLMQQWIQHQNAYSANIEYMRHHYWLLDHFVHPVEEIVCSENPVLVSLKALCARHNDKNEQRMATTHALDGRGAAPKSTKSDFALRLYRAAIDMRFIHHKLAILLATSLANKPSQKEGFLAAFDLVIEPESCDHELLDWQQFRSTSWVRAFLAEQAIADTKKGKFQEIVRKSDLVDFYSMLKNISPADVKHPHTFFGKTHTHIDSDQAEKEALRMLEAGGESKGILQASYDKNAILEIQKTKLSFHFANNNVPLKSPEKYKAAYFRRMLFLAYRMRLDSDLAVCMPHALRAVFRVGEPATTQARPWNPNEAPWDLESLTYTTGRARLDPAIPIGKNDIPVPPKIGPQERPNEADLAGVEANLSVPITWVHIIITQLERMIPADLQVKVLSAKVASERYPESRFSPSYSVTIEEEEKKDYLIRLDACEMYMVYKAISHVLPEELTHNEGVEQSMVEQVTKSRHERRGRRVMHIQQNAVACSSGTWKETSLDSKPSELVSVYTENNDEKSLRVKRASEDARNGLGFVLHYNGADLGVNDDATFVDKRGVRKVYKRPEPRGCKRRLDSMHDTLDERSRPIAPSVRKYEGKQYKAYYVHNGLGAPSAHRVAFFCHGAYALLIRACDRARFVETIRRQIPYDIQVDFGRLGYRIMPVDRFREEWGLRRRVAYTPADEIAPPIWTGNGESTHTDLNVGVERAQGYGTWEKRRTRLKTIHGVCKRTGVNAPTVPLRAFKFPRRKSQGKREKEPYGYDTSIYYTNPASYWGLVEWLSVEGSLEKTGDFRMTGDADTLNPLLTVLAYLDTATTDMPEKTRAECAPIDYLQYDYLNIAGPGFKELPVFVSSGGERPLTLSSCLILKI